MIEIWMAGFFILIAVLGLFTTVRAAFITTFFALLAFGVFAFREFYQLETSLNWTIITFSMILFFLVFFYLLIAKIKSYYDKNAMEADEMIKNFDVRMGQINQSNQDIVRSNQELKKKSSELSLIYNSIKSMSSTLDFNQILKGFCQDLDEMAQFQKGRLILVNLENYEKNSFQIIAVYETNSVGLNQPVCDTVEKSQFDFTVMELILKSKKEKLMDNLILFESEKDVRAAHPVLASINPAFPMYLLPLEVKNEILGVLVAQGMEKDAYQKVNIILNHFAMEIKKIRLYEKLKSLSLIDGLTGLYLRRHFIKRLEEELERVTRNKSILSLMMFDIDDFKSINDKYGHSAGDIILKETSNIIKSNSREIDLIGRYGGDEIIMALPMTDKEKAREIAERIRRMVENHRFSTTYGLIHATISTGIASFPGNDIKTSVDLISASDGALYAAKGRGKNSVNLH